MNSVLHILIMCWSTLMDLLINIRNIYEKPLISCLKLGSIWILINVNSNVKRLNT